MIQLNNLKKRQGFKHHEKTQRLASNNIEYIENKMNNVLNINSEKWKYLDSSIKNVKEQSNKKQEKNALENTIPVSKRIDNPNCKTLHDNNVKKNTKKKCLTNDCYVQCKNKGRHSELPRVEKPLIDTNKPFLKRQVNEKEEVHFHNTRARETQFQFYRNIESQNNARDNKEPRSESPTLNVSNVIFNFVSNITRLLKEDIISTPVETYTLDPAHYFDVRQDKEKDLSDEGNCENVTKLLNRQLRVFTNEKSKPDKSENRNVNKKVTSNSNDIFKYEMGSGDRLRYTNSKQKPHKNERLSILTVAPVLEKSNARISSDPDMVADNSTINNVNQNKRSKKNIKEYDLCDTFQNKLPNNMKTMETGVESIRSNLGCGDYKKLTNCKDYVNDAFEKCENELSTMISKRGFESNEIDRISENKNEMSYYITGQNFDIYDMESNYFPTFRNGTSISNGPPTLQSNKRNDKVGMSHSGNGANIKIQRLSEESSRPIPTMYYYNQHVFRRSNKRKLPFGKCKCLSAIENHVSSALRRLGNLLQSQFFNCEEKYFKNSNRANANTRPNIRPIVVKSYSEVDTDIKRDNHQT